MNNNLLREDFSYAVTANGYTVKYKGQSIGGAGIIGQSKSRGKARTNDMKEYSNSAERDISNLLSNNTPAYMMQTIEKINNSTP